MKTFGIEWKRQGRLMVGSPWAVEGTQIYDLPHRLTLPENLWPEYRAFLLALGTAMDAAGLIDGPGSLTDEMADLPNVQPLRPKGVKAR